MKEKKPHTSAHSLDKKNLGGSISRATWEGDHERALLSFLWNRNTSWTKPWRAMLILMYFEQLAHSSFYSCVTYVFPKKKGCGGQDERINKLKDVSVIASL